MANVSFLRKSPDGKWLHCPQCSRAYWGAFRPTDFVRGKFDAHCAKAHKAEAGDAPADADKLLGQALADIGEKPVTLKPARKPAQGKRAAAKAARKGDGPVRVVREGPNTAELLGEDLAALVAEVNVDIAPRLQGGQGPRNFSDEGNNRFEGARRVRDAGKGQDVIARVQAALSPIKGWA